MLTVGLPLGLWVGGAQPVAVGLIPPPWDKLAHACVFAVLALCIGYASGWRGRRLWLLAFGGAVTVGVLDEWHQASLPGRSAGLDDLAADALGAALGAWLIHLRHR
nr:VanZ family protein [Rhodoferax sp. U2-2l]